MRKIIYISLLAVILIVLGAVGGVYAIDHQPLQGNKLTGTGALGIAQLGPSTNSWSTVFLITNPDCNSDIKINKVSLIRCDENLNTEVVYEGPLINTTLSGTRTIVTNLSPHQTVEVALPSWMYTGGGSDPNDPTEANDWMDPGTASSQPRDIYTFEIKWTTKGLPLIGQRITNFSAYYNSGPYAGQFHKYSWGTAMENLVQKDK